MRGFFLFSALSLSVYAVDVPFSVEEPASVPRTGEPVTCGLAFKKGECTDISKLALFSGGIEIPAQFSPLVTFEGGSRQWVQVDFTDNFTSRQLKQYTVKQQSPAAAPSQSISVSATGSLVEINTGPLRFQIDTANFAGITAAWVDGQQVAGGAGGGLTLISQVTNQTYNNGKVTSAKFLYRGPLRVTLRVEGEFYHPSCGGMGYAFTATAYAGSRRVKLEISLRNSINPLCGHMDKITRASFTLPLTFTPTEISLTALNYLKAFQDGTKGLFVVEGWAGGYYPAIEHNIIPSGNGLRVDLIKTGATGSGYNGGVWDVYDLAHKNTEIFLDFYTGSKTTTDLSTNKLKELKSKLVGRPEPNYLSATEALSSGKFGTLEDEIATYTKWGWTFSLTQMPKMGHNFNAAMEGNLVHDETETDNGEGMLLQWNRTGSRGFFDEGESWCRYYKTQYAFRSIGFEYDGQYDVSAYVLGKAKRTSQTVGGEPSIYGDMAKSVVDIPSYGGCHFYGSGLVDYYCLTGDRDALEAAIDLAEIVWTRADRYMGAGRGPGRQMQVLVRVYEAMRDTLWKNRMNYAANQMLSAEMDPRGFWNYGEGVQYFYSTYIQTQAGFPDSLKQYIAAHGVTATPQGNDIIIASGGKSWRLKSMFGSWEETYGQLAMDRYYRASGDERACDFVIGFAQNAARLVMSRCGQVPYIMHFDYPIKNTETGTGFFNWDPVHDICPGNFSLTPNSLPAHDGWYTVFYPGACGMGYRYSGYPNLIQKAKEYWNNGSKRGYQSTAYSTGPTQLYTFAYHKAPKDDGLLNTNSMFYEIAKRTDTLPPAGINDLKVSRLGGSGGTLFSWTAPSDNSGSTVEYQLKYSKDLTIVDYPNYDYAVDDLTKVPWWFAQNASGEPVPGPSGAPQGFTLQKTFPTTEVWYAAVCARDAAGNLSPLSNVVRIDNTTGIEDARRVYEVITLLAAPNPTSGDIVFRLGAGPAARGKMTLSVYDPTGRLVKSFGPAIHQGVGEVVWRMGKNKLPSGVYYARLTQGNRMVVKKVVVSR